MKGLLVLEKLFLNPFTISSFQDITTISDFYDFLSTSVANALVFDDTDMDGPIFLVQNTFVSPVRLRQVRTTTRGECKKIANPIINIQCYNVEYNDDTKDTEELTGSTDDWAKYKTKEQNNIFSTIRGFSSDYDGSGYVHDFSETAMYFLWITLSHNILSKSDVTTLISNLKSANAFNYQTRAVFINANFYSQGMDLLLEIELVIFCSSNKPHDQNF